MSKDTDWAALYGDHPQDDSDGPSRPPIWVAFLVVAAVVMGGWVLFTQVFAESDPVTSSTTLPLIPVEASVVTTTTAPVVTTTTASPTAGDPVSVLGNPPAAVTAESPQQLAGHVAVTSRSLNRGTVWVFRPGGSLVSRADFETISSALRYPMLITAGHLLLGGHIGGGQMVDIGLAEPPKPLWTAGSVLPGSVLLGSGRPGVVWLWLRSTLSGDYSLVSTLDLETGTMGELVDMTDLFYPPVAGVADGLIVIDLDGELAFWSPTDGLVPLDQLGDLDTVVAASGNLVVIDSEITRVEVLDIVSGEKVASFELPELGDPVTSACLSPDGQHVIVVGRNGEAVVGDMTTGKVIRWMKYSPIAEGHEFSVQRKHGIGWTTDDQLVFIAELGDAKHILGLDVATGDRFDVATLEGPEEWWLTASGTMC